MNIGALLKRLEDRELIIPSFEASIRSGEWPESYTVTIDSSPYYGLKDLDGEGGKGGSGDGYFHPSSTPFWGDRRLFLAYHPKYSKEALPEPKTLQGEMTLSMGSALHGVIQTQMLMSGLIKGEEDIEVEYVNEEHRCRGRVDFVVTHPVEGRVPVELKTMNSYSYANLTEIRDYWDAQLSMGLDNLGYDMGILLVLESGWPYRMREFRVTRNDKMLSEIYDKYHRTLDALELDEVPPPCCSLGSSTMKECPFRYFCWGDEA